MNQPYVVGQSGTERPDPVLVTRPPAKIKMAVETATRRAKRCKAIASQKWEVESLKSEVRSSSNVHSLKLNPISLLSLAPIVTV